MANKQQTSVEWLVENSEYFFGNLLAPSIIHQALQMEREQIIEAFDEGQEYEYQYHVNSTPKFDSETYFNETYGK